MKRLCYYHLPIILIIFCIIGLTACGKNGTLSDFNSNSELLIDLGTSEKNLGDISKYTKNDYGGLSLDAGYYLVDNENEITYKISGLTSKRKLKIITEIQTTSNKISFYGLKVGMSFDESAEALEILKNAGYNIAIADNEYEYECEKDNIRLRIRLSFENEIWSLVVNFIDAIDIRVMID